MGVNTILPFCVNSDPVYVETDAQYLADTQRVSGNIPGQYAKTELDNKAFKQSSLISAGVGQYLADNQIDDIDDNLTPAQISSYFTDAIQATPAITQPQFDASTKVATDQFVQRALGNAQQTLLIDGVSPTYTLTPAQVGSYVLVNPSAPMTITLPLASACPSGGLFRVAVFSTNIIFAAQGGNVINDGGVNLSTYPVFQGGFVDFLWDGAGVWIVAGGNTNIDKQPGWEYLDANPGFTRFPNGRLEQEGSAIFNAPASISVFISVTINFAIPFSAKPLAPPSFSISTYNNVYDNDISELVCGTLSWTDSTATALISRVAGNAPVAPLWLNVRATGRG